MYHAPYERIVPGAKKAVLFVHGILSTPRFFDDYVAALPEELRRQVMEGIPVEDEAQLSRLLEDCTS